MPPSFVQLVHWGGYKVVQDSAPAFTFILINIYRSSTMYQALDSILEFKKKKNTISYLKELIV